MPIVRNADAAVFELPGLRVLGLASPKRGARETCAWRVQVAPGVVGALHRITREEVFVALSGTAVATLDGAEHEVHAGDALVVPSGTAFALGNRGAEPFEAVVAFPVGGQAITSAAPFTPPWAE